MSKRTTLIFYALTADTPDINETCKWYGIDDADPPRTLDIRCVDPKNPKVIVGYCKIVNASETVCKDLVAIGAIRYAFERAEFDESGTETKAEDFPLVEKEKDHVVTMTERVKLPDTLDTQAKRDAKTDEVKSAFSRLHVGECGFKVPARDHEAMLDKFLAMRGVERMAEVV